MAKEVIAVDLGGTNLRVALVKKGKILKYIKKDTPKTKNELIKMLVDTISEMDTKKVRGIGVGCPGPLDAEKGIILNPPNLPFKNFNLQKYLVSRFKKKVVIENDANCVALAEAKLGVKKKNFFILTIGTGVGGGIIINGELYTGKGFAGELGHIILDNGRDMESLVAFKRQRELTRKYFGRELLIKDLLKMKDKRAKKILDEIFSYLGMGIASLINVFDPEVIVLSGGFKEAGRPCLNILTQQVKRYSILPRNTKIEFTKLDHPGTLGAALLI
ncbi:MAG: ROK family protein [archaeon]